MTSSLKDVAPRRHRTVSDQLPSGLLSRSWGSTFVCPTFVCPTFRAGQTLHPWQLALIDRSDSFDRTSRAAGKTRPPLSQGPLHHFTSPGPLHLLFTAVYHPLSFRYLSPPFRYLSPPFRYLSPPFRYLSPPFRYLSPPFRYLSPPLSLPPPPLYSSSSFFP